MAQKIKGICHRIRMILDRFPNSEPKEIAKMLWISLRAPEKEGFTESSFYLKYRHLIWTEKWAFWKWRKTEVLGRPLRSLPGHRVEYEFERPLARVYIERIGFEAEKFRPGRRDPKPVGEWYVVPNRNRAREFHDDDLSFRIFPQSGTVRILPGREISYLGLVYAVEKALFMGGIPIDVAEILARTLIPSSVHKTFRIGRVEPFRVDHYKDSLGLTILSDGSHPQHLETIEEWPPWIRIQIESNMRISQALDGFSENFRRHIGALEGIEKAVNKLMKVLERLERAP